MHHAAGILLFLVVFLFHIHDPALYYSDLDFF
jgi:hypothetical protein